MNTDNKIVTDGIKSQDRVKKHGEVFTPVHIVKDMTNLINEGINKKLDEQGITDLAERKRSLLTKTWLEPACGTGNFLVEILKDKLKYIEELIELKTEISAEIDVYTLIAVSTIYAIDIQLDNVLESRARLINTPGPNDKENGYETLTDWYKRITGKKMSKRLLDSAKYITERNIIHGNALTGTIYAGHGEYSENTGVDIRIIEWKFSNNHCKLEEVSFNSMKGGSMGIIVEDYNNKEFDIYNLRECENSATADDDIEELF